MSSKSKILSLNNIKVDNFVVVEDTNSIKFKIKEYGALKIDFKLVNDTKHQVVLTTSDGSFESEEADTSAVSSLFGIPALNFLPQFLTFFESNDGEINFVAANEALAILFISKGKEAKYIISTEDKIDLSGVDPKIKNAFLALESKFTSKLAEVEKKLDVLLGAKGNSNPSTNSSSAPAEVKEVAKVKSTFDLEHAKKFKVTDKIKIEREQNYYCWPQYAEVDDKLYAVGINKWIEIREKGSNDVIHAWEAHKNQITAMTAHSNYIISGSDGHIIVWDKITYQKVRSYKTDDTVDHFSKFSNTLFASACNSVISLYDPTQDALVKKLEGHTSSIKALFLNLAGDSLISLGWDKTIRIWSTKTKKAIDCIDANINIRSGCALDDNLLVINGDNRTHLWDLNTRKMIKEIETDQNPGDLYAMAYLGNGFFLGAGERRVMNIWNYQRDVHHVAAIPGHEQDVVRIIIMDDGLIFSSDKCSYMIEWN